MTDEEELLWERIEKGDLEAVKEVFKRNTYWNDKEHLINTCSAHGHLECVKWLVENGVDPEYDEQLAYVLADLNDKKHIIEYFTNVKRLNKLKQLDKKDNQL